MRTKTFLFFIILISGVAFSQHGQGTGPDKNITLTKIIEFLEIGRYSSIRMEAMQIGYKTIAPYEFSNGRHSFKWVVVDKKTNPYYRENWTLERKMLLKEQASRLKLGIDKESKDYLEMSNSNYLLKAYTEDRIEVFLK